MKKLLVVLAVMFTLPFFGNSQSINWMSFEEAVELNKKEPKKIIVDVYTDWCGWCKKMDSQTFTNEEVINYINQHFYAVKFNAETNDTIIFNHKMYVRNGRINTLTIKLLGDEIAYPAYVALDENNNVIYRTLGYMDAPTFMQKLRAIVNRKQQ